MYIVYYLYRCCFYFASVPLSIPPRTNRVAHVYRYSFAVSFHGFQVKVAELSPPRLAGALSASIMIALLCFALRSVSCRDLSLAFELCIPFRALFPCLSLERMRCT